MATYLGIDFGTYSSGESWGGDFDAVLWKSNTGALHYKLTIYLRIRLAQLNPNRYAPVTTDADGNAFFIRPWSGTDWANFTQTAERQAGMWNNKFWLKGKDVSDYDYVDFSGDVWRPYIRCELDVDFNASAANAHKTIEVANLDTRMYAGAHDSSFFRSHALLYDSLDTTPVVYPIPDHTGAVNNMQHYTIPHEIGHSLGLGHIGELMKTPLCRLAVTLEGMGVDKGHPDTTGGSNSNYCYGFGQKKHIGENVMGFGAGFSKENAKPWIWALRSLSKRQWYESWEVTMEDPVSHLWLAGRKK